MTIVDGKIIGKPVKPADESKIDKSLVLFSADDVAKATGTSITTSRSLFHRSDFPSFRLGRKLFVERSQLFLWLSQHHDY